MVFFCSFYFIRIPFIPFLLFYPPLRFSTFLNNISSISKNLLSLSFRFFISFSVFSAYLSHLIFSLHTNNLCYYTNPLFSIILFLIWTIWSFLLLSFLLHSRRYFHYFAASIVSSPYFHIIPSFWFSCRLILISYSFLISVNNVHIISRCSI